MATASPTPHEQFYVVGGNLHPDAPSYVRRQADDDLYDALGRGEFCYILTSRQMGKSSLIVRTATRLAQDGVKVVTIDLTSLGQNLTAEQWYSGLLQDIGDRLDLEDELDDFEEQQQQVPPVRRLIEALRRVVLSAVEGRIVIFLDEIDVAQSLPFSANEFFAAIRHCYTRRSEDPKFERLSFCLAGVATPSDLIDDPLTTPFNIGTRIELTDFAEDEAVRLAEGLGREDAVAAMLVRRVLHWTNGHPYLTQRVCQAAQGDDSVRTSADVDRLCEELFFSERARDQDPNLQFVRNQMLWRDLDHAALLGMYGDVLRSKSVTNDETNPLVNVLRLAGIVRVDGGKLVAKNRIYGRVFNRQWVRDNMPDAELRRQRAAAAKAVVRTAAIAAVVVLSVSILATIALQQSRTARETSIKARLASSRAQIERGVQLLESEDSMGLHYLLGAARVAPDQSDMSLSARRLWAGWHAVYAGRLVAVADSENVSSVSFSGDGSRILAAASSGGHVGVWDTRTLTKTETVFEHKGGGYGVASNRDGTLAATAVGDAAVLWDPVTGEAIGDAFPHDGLVFAVAFSPDGKYLATASTDSTARVWDIASGVALTAPLTHAGSVFDVEFSPDSALVATASSDNTAGVWSVATGSRLYDGLKHDDQVEGVSFSPDGTRLATTSDDASLRMWDVATGSLTAEPVLYDVGLGRVRFSPDGSLLITGSSGAAQIWDSRSLQRIDKPLRHGDSAWAVDYSADGKTVLVASSGSMFLLWNARSDGWARRHIPHPGSVAAASFHPDGRVIATAGSDRTVLLWNPSSGEPLTDPLVHDAAVEHVQFSPDGARLLTATKRTIRFWEMDGAEIPEMRKGFEHSIRDVDYGVTGRVVVAATAGGVYLWNPMDVDRGEPVGGPYTLDVALSPDGSLLAIGLLEGVELWDVATQTPTGLTIPSTAPVYDLSFSPDGNTLAVASHHPWLRLWDVSTAVQVGAPIPHASAISRVIYSPDGSLVATSSRDGRVRLWDVATRMLLSAPFHLPGESRSAGLAFSPDGTSMVTATRRRAGAEVWEIPDMPDDFEEMQLRTWVTLGSRLHEHGVEKLIPAAEWRALRAQLPETAIGQGGP